MQSDCRGEKRITSAPNRAMSNRAAATAISSIAQHAKPMGIGHMEFVRIQLIAASRRETTTSPSILLLYASSAFSETMAGSTKKRFKLPPDLGHASRFWVKGAVTRADSPLTLVAA